MQPSDVVRKKDAVLLVSCALLQAAFTLYYALIRLHSFKGSLLDSGTFDQVFWNWLHTGAPLATTNPPFDAEHWLGFHFSPLLALLLPLYALFPGPELFQWVQSFCLAFAAIPLFFIARHFQTSKAEAWFCACCYWLNPFVLSAALWDFHEIAFAVPLLSLALLPSARGVSLLCLSASSCCWSRRRSTVSVS